MSESAEMTTSEAVSTESRRGLIGFFRHRTWKFWLLVAFILAAIAFFALWIYLAFFYGADPLPPFDRLSPDTVPAS